MSSKKDHILRLLLSGVPHGQIAVETGASKGTISYHAKRAGLGKPELCLPGPDSVNSQYRKHYTATGRVVFHCVWCGRIVSKRRKYCNSSCQKAHKDLTSVGKNLTNSERVAAWRRRTKAKAVEYKGGSCRLCGYCKSHRALDFHHVDPAQKEFAISRKGITRAWEKIKVELDKCILLCRNCHAEVHAGVVSVDLEKLLHPDSNEEDESNNLA